jgi:hypothetical protein
LTNPYSHPLIIHPSDKHTSTPYITHFNMQLTNSLLLLALTLSAAAASPVQFTRRQQGSNISYPPAGGTPPRSMTPQSWIDALNAAHAAGKIPDIPQSLNRCVFFSLPAFHIAHPC